jgi:hypothetical protein
MRDFPTVSIIQAIGAVGLALVVTAAGPARSRGGSASASAQSVVVRTFAASRAGTIGPGFPADFPLAPGLSPCKAVVDHSYTICIWHGVDGHAVYTFYRQSLLKAGYTIVPGGGEDSKVMYLGVFYFTKGTFKGVLRVIGTDLTIMTPPDARPPGQRNE